MRLNGVAIDDSFAEAFPMKAVRLIVTAATPAWAEVAARSMTGFATSVIACGCEAAIERALSAEETPDGRPGVAVLVFAMSTKDLAKQVRNRVGQCVLTCATTACFAGTDGEKRVPLGDGLRYFADGFQLAKQFGGKRFWRVPVMEGEFVCQDTVGVVQGIGGGNFLILATGVPAALAAAEAAVGAIDGVADVILPFPGGIVRSGSKVGSKYKGLIASTNDAYCPTLRGQTETALPDDVGAVLEIVIDGLSEGAIEQATAVGIRAACALGRERGVIAIHAGNYGGKLGPHHFHLHRLVK